MPNRDGGVERQAERQLPKPKQREPWGTAKLPRPNGNHGEAPVTLPGSGGTLFQEGAKTREPSRVAETSSTHSARFI